MAKGSDSANSGNQQENGDDGLQFLGEDEIDAGREQTLTVDTAIRLKTVSVGYCNMLPERCKITGKRAILGRIGGTMMGVADQIRNPQEVAKGAAPDIGVALVGSFSCDVYSDDGEITGEFEGGFCYLPGGFQEAEITKFSQLTPEQQAKGHVFSWFIASEPSTNPRGYRYVLANAMRVNINRQAIEHKLRAEAALIATGKVRGNPLLEHTPADAR